MTDAEPYLTLDFGEAGTRTFNDRDECLALLEKEEAAWKWLTEMSGARRPAIWKNIRNRQYGEANSKIAQVQSTEDRTTVLTVMGEFAERYRAQNCLLSDTPEGAFVCDLGERKSTRALYLLMIFMDEELGPVTKDMLLAGYGAGLFDEVRSDLHETEKKSLSALHDEWTSQINRMKQDYAQFLKDRELSKSEFNTDQETRRIESSKQLDEMTTAWESLKETYEKHLQLESSVRLWENRATSHGRTVFWAGAACTIGFALMAALLFWEIDTWLLMNMGVPGAEINYPALSLVLLTASLGLIFVKTLVKILMSNLHLQAVSKERATMAETYQALVKEEGPAATSHRHLVLEALFRPVATGLIAHEDSPNSPVEAIAKIIGKS